MEFVTKQLENQFKFWSYDVCGFESAFIGGGASL